MNLTCPECQSSETKWIEKKQKWLCTACAEQFDGPASDPTTASPDSATPSPISSPLDPIPDSPSPTPPSRSDKAAAPKKIFFSYGHDANRELVDRFKADLEKRGHKVWIDYDQIRNWDQWRGKITEGIQESEMTVAFLSIHSTRDPGVCRNEIAMALHHFGVVYPIMVEPVPSESIPVTIDHLQWPDLSEWKKKKETDPSEFERFYEEKFLEIVNRLEGNATRFASEVDVLKQVLKPHSFDSIFAQHLEGFVGRAWVFDAYSQWLDHQPDSRVFWLKAGPGFGKSALAVNLADRQRAAICATWFCNSQSIELRDPVRAVMTISFQLATRWDDYRTRLLPALGLNEKSQKAQIDEAIQCLATKNLNDLFTLLIADPLALLPWKRQNKLVILIDALDEATDSDGKNALTALISGRFLELPKWISFVVTSRPDASVVGHLQRFKPFELSAEDSRNTEDLALYCRQEIGGLKVLESLNATEKEKLCARLVEKAEGMILYLRMVVEGLKERTLSVGDLDAMEGGIGGLYSRYYQTFSSRFNEIFESDLASFLGLLLVAKAPLPHEVAKAVLGITSASLNKIISSLGSYLDLEGRGYRLFHKSLGDWLLIKDHPFSVDMAEARNSFANYFQRDLGRDLHDEMANSYARKYGVDHLLDEGRTESADKVLTDFHFMSSKASHNEVADLVHQYGRTMESIDSDQSGDPEAPSVALNRSALNLWSDKRILEENQRIYRSVNPWDNLSQFKSFISANFLSDLELPGEAGDFKNSIREFAGKPTFIASLAFNSLPQGTLGAAGRDFLCSTRNPYLRRRWGKDEDLVLQSALRESYSNPFRIHAVALAWRNHSHAVVGVGGKIILRQSGHEAGRLIDTGCRNLFFIKISPEGDALIAAGEDGSIHFCPLGENLNRQVHSGARFCPDPATGDEIRTHAGTIQAMDVCFRRMVYVTGCGAGKLSAWSFSGDLLWHAGGLYQGNVSSIAITEKEDVVVTVGHDGMLHVLDLLTGRVVTSRREEGKRLLSVCVDESGSTILFGYQSGAMVWDREKDKTIPFSGHEGAVSCVAMTPWGDRFVTGGRYDRTIRVWSPDGMCLRVLEGHIRDVTGVAISPDGLKVYSAGWDCREIVWDIKKAGLPPSPREKHRLNVPCMIFSGTGTLYSGGWDRTVRKWDANGLKCIETWEGHAGTVNGLAVSSSGEKILSCGDRGELILWESSGGVIVTRLTGHKGLVRSVSFSSCGQFAVTAGKDKSIRVWDLDSGKESLILPGHQDEVTAALFTPDGSKIVSASHDGDLRIWSAVTGECQGELIGHTDKVRNLLLSPDGRTAYSGSWDKSIRAWDLKTGEVLFHIPAAHDLIIRTLALSSDGRYLYSGSWDRTVRVWDTESAKCVCALGVRGVESLALNEDGGVLAVGSNLGEVVFYDVCNLA